MDKKRKIITCVVIVLAFVLFCVGIFSASAFYLTAKIIDEKPSINPVEQEVPQPEAVAGATAKVQELFMAVMNPSPEKEKTLSLSGDEINALISMGQNVQQFSGNQEPDKKIFVNFKDSKFTVAFSKKLDFSTPFGSYLNVCVVIVPELSAQSKDIKIDSLKIGDISLSSAVLGKGQLGAFLNLFCGLGGAGKDFTDTVKSISIDNAGNLVIVYDPAKLKLLIQDKLTEKMSGQSGE